MPSTPASTYLLMKPFRSRMCGAAFYRPASTIRLAPRAAVRSSRLCIEHRPSTINSSGEGRRAVRRFASLSCEATSPDAPPRSSFDFMHRASLAMNAARIPTRTGVCRRPGSYEPPDHTNHRRARLRTEPPQGRDEKDDETSRHHRRRASTRIDGNRQLGAIGITLPRADRERGFNSSRPSRSRF